MAEIINLSEVRTARANSRQDDGRAETFWLLGQIRRNLGLPDDYKGKFVVMRRDEAERLTAAAKGTQPEPEEKLSSIMLRDLARQLGLPPLEKVPQ